MFRLPVLVFVAAGALVAAAGCAPATGQVERSLERELPRALGPADRYDVRVTGLQLRNGHAERVVVRGEGVRPNDAPRLARLDVELHGVTVDRRRERLERVDSTHAVVRVAAVDLARYLEEQRGVREASVTLHGADQGTLRLRPDLPGLPVPRSASVELEGQFLVEGGAVRFEVERVLAGGMDLGPMAARRISEEINPVLDLRRQRGAFRVTALRVDADALELNGTADLAGLALRDG